MDGNAEKLQQIILRWTRELNELAKAWIAAGAERYALVLDSEPTCLLWSYPEKAVTALEWGYSVPISAASSKRVRVCVERLPDGNHDVWMQMLHANAKMIAGFLVSEKELNELTEAVVRTQDRVVALYDLTQILSRPLDLPGMLETLIVQLCVLTGVNSGVGLLKHPTRQEYQQNVSLAAEELDLYFNDLARQGKRFTVTLENRQSMLLLPLIMPERMGEIDGMIGLISDQPLQSPLIKLAKAAIDQAGVHFENIVHFETRVLQTRIQTELDLARSVQTRLLPSSPSPIAGLDVWGESRPAFEVGGDFFDFFSEPNTPFLFSVGDVSGKGLSAALVMTMARTAIRSVAAFTPSPVTIMKLANRNLYNDFTELDKLATVFIGKVDVQLQQITFANAGHSPVVYTDSEIPAALVEADSPPLGVLPKFLGESHTIDLPQTGVLIVASDGFVETENSDGEMYGYTRFLECIDSVKHLKSVEIVKKLFRSVSDFRGATPQHDDETVIVIKRTTCAEMSSNHD